MNLMMAERAGAKACLWVKAGLAGSVGSCKLLTGQVATLLIVGHGCRLIKAIMLLMLAICQLQGEATMRCCHVPCRASSYLV